METPSNKVFKDLFLANPNSVELANVVWAPFRDGVEISVLYSSGGGISSALLRYAAGARVPVHRHVGYEQIFVLQGEQSDERGSYPAGSVVVNLPGSSHWVSSANGCIVLAVWEKPVEFVTE